jgi:hypothetical protein
MKKTINRRTALEELIPDESKRKEMIGLLYQGAPILGEGGILHNTAQSGSSSILVKVTRSGIKFVSGAV